MVSNFSRKDQSRAKYHHRGNGLLIWPAEHPNGFNNDTSTTSNKNESDTPSVYTTAQSNLEMLQLYHDDDLVPDEAAAILIGEAKGRSDGMLSVPPSVDGKSNKICYSG